MLLLTLFGCKKDAAERSASGQALYEEPLADGNVFACADCHALTEPADDGLRRPGHPIGDAAARPSWKNGQVDSLREAVGSCQEEWMNATPWAASDPDWQALEAFLVEQAPDSADALSFTIVDPPTDTTGGDADTGRDVFNDSCAVCHGTDGTGTGKAPPVAGFGQPGDYVSQRVRTSGRADSAVYDGLTGGVMPFWSLERLSESELLDIVAYLGDGELPVGDDDDDDDDTDPPEGCDATHAKVGATATLTEIFHDVGGTAEIIDDCTVEIRDFTFDGLGVNVQIYGALDEDYENGFSMSDNLVKNGGYDGDTIYATLPDGMDWDDVDGVSVWCVPVGVDFGSGTF